MEKLAQSRQVVALSGRLGNQLFQYSYAQYLAQKGWRVNLDLSCVRHGIPAIFEIPLIGDRARQMVLPVTRFIPSPSGRLPLIGIVSRKAMRPGRIVLDESPQGPEPPASVTPSWWFGYWQRLRYAEAIIPLLKTSLDPAPPCGTTDEDRTVRALVNVRRGDYAGNPCELPAEWYKRALDMVYELGGDGVETEVISDSPEWCKQNLDLGREFKVVLPTGTPLDHLRYLAAADFVVISRSTFSWWAAAISNATVIAPDPWFPEMSRGETQNIFPGTWLSCATS